LISGNEIVDSIPGGIDCQQKQAFVFLESLPYRGPEVLAFEISFGKVDGQGRYSQRLQGVLGFFPIAVYRDFEPIGCKKEDK
jgi:hypothetical protein